MRHLIGIAAVLLASAGLLIPAGGAAAQPYDLGPLTRAQDPINPFSALVGERRETRREHPGAGEIERYVLATDNRALVIESQRRTARVKFLCAPGDLRLDCTLDPLSEAAEIYLLAATRGPRGDIIYKNAEGDTLLRRASYGGATVFWPGEERGRAASRSFGDDPPLRLAFADRETATRRATAATALISALAGSPIPFEIGPAPIDVIGADSSVLADAVVRAAKAMNAVAGDATGAQILGARIENVRFGVGPAPSVSLEKRTLRINYVPDQDIAGRPSSRAIERFLEESL
ncbi:MAG: DUF4908 domain-containing protein [Pseudomonadota bacterium]